MNAYSLNLLKIWLTHGGRVETRWVKNTAVEFESNDGEYDDGEEHKQRNLQERSHGFENGLENHLKTCLKEVENWILKRVQKRLKKLQKHIILGIFFGYLFGYT